MPQGKLATILTDGYQDLVKQIASSVTVGSGVTSLVGPAAAAPAAAASSAAAAAVAGPSAATSAAAGQR